MNLKHITVMKKEAIEYLVTDAKGIYVDGTLGGGGHTKEILQTLDPMGKVFAFDQDMVAIEYAKEKLKDFSNIQVIQSNFRDIREKLGHFGITAIDGLMLDLGLSSFQIDDADRGFTYLKDTELDMRMDRMSEVTAKTIVNTYDLDALAKILYVYGEEKNSYKIARRIIEQRPLQTTMELVKICDSVNAKEKGHSSKRVFQALRIAVNDELAALEKVLDDGYDMLKPGGRMVVITFHSLEDRIVKHFFKQKSTVDVPKHLPIRDLPDPEAILVTKKPIYPSEEEINDNPRSKSAKLRVLEKHKKS